MKHLSIEQLYYVLILVAVIIFSPVPTLHAGRKENTMKTLINTIICNDCRQLLPTIPDKSFQLAFADPPYWVGFDYGNLKDTEMEYVEPHFLVNELLRISNCVLVTPGNSNQYKYPEPNWTIAWNKPASTGRSYLKGYSIWEPVFVYGKPPKVVWQDAFTAPGGRENDAQFHKCPKPVSLLRWLVDQFSEIGDNVIDPMCGSGTTCKAAFELGRNYLGIEIDPNIVKQSLARLSKCNPPLPIDVTSQKQMDFFNG